jgi:hypothetical protein
LAILPVFALAAFLVASPASDLVSGADFAAAAATGEVAPVVLVVLDELPTASIVDAEGRIDAVRFPNLAALAGEATWYRNHTTQSGFTDSAVPTILTGREPRAVAPLFTQNPDNLFRLLAGSHDLVVSEAITRLCPTAVCGDTPRAPPSSTSADEPEVEDVGPSMGPLFGDAVDLWTQRVSGSDAGVSFEAFEEEAASVEPTVDVEVTDPTFGAGEHPTEIRPWEDAVANQPQRLTDFLDALQPGDKPVAAVLHLIAPHYPWHYLPDGREYAAPSFAADLPINGGGDPWVADVERQRHLLQASYVDRLVGQILERLEEVGLYDEAAVVVTADHGIAFREGLENRRLPEREALPEIMWTPLLVKAPGQTEPRIDDTNVQNVDVLPTIASLIGADIPWEVDGVDLTRAGDASDRGDTKTFHRFESGADPNPDSVVEVDASDGFAEVLGLAFPPLAADADPVSALYERSGRGDLFGEPFEPTGEVPSDTFAVDDLDRLLAGPLPTLVLTGTVDGEVGEDHVVAAVDGRIVAISPVVDRVHGGAAFALLLPTDDPIDLGDVHLALVRGAEVLDGGALGG